MSLLYILDFYVKNSLSLGKVNYDEKFNHLAYFFGKPLNIDTITDYCLYRTLQGVKNTTINRELTILRSAVNFYNKHHKKELKNPLNNFKFFETDFTPHHLTPQECTYNASDTTLRAITVMISLIISRHHAPNGSDTFHRNYEGQLA